MSQLHESIEKLLEEEFLRLKKNNKNIEHIKKQLEESQLNPYDINMKITKELIRVSTLKYEEIQQTNITTRLEGFGWSKQRIQDHMKRFVKDILTQISIVLKSEKKKEILTQDITNIVNQTIQRDEE